MMLTLLTFTFGGCSQTKVKYVQTQCPKLVKFGHEQNSTLLNEKLKLSVPLVDDSTTKLLLESNADKFDFLKMGLWGFVELDKLKELSLKMQQLKSDGKECEDVIKLYEMEIDDFNDRSKKITPKKL